MADLTNDKHNEVEQLKQQLKAVEEELSGLNEKISTEAAENVEAMKQTIADKTKQAEELKDNIKKLEEDCKEKAGSVYEKTTDAIGSAKERVSEKIGDIKNSETVKNIGEKIEGAYTSVKESIMGKSDASKGDS